MNTTLLSKETRFNVGIVDDDFAIRDGYKSLFRQFELVGKVTCYENAADMLQDARQGLLHFVLLDIRLKEEDGLEVCKFIKQHFKNIRVLIFSSYHDKPYIIRADQHRADGYLFKDAPPEEVKNAFEKIMRFSGQYYPTEAKEVLFDHQRSYARPAHDAKAGLTSREMEIIRLICEGKSNKEIAEILSREETTIAKHRQNIMSKVGAKKTIELYDYAIQYGYYSPRVSARAGG